MARNWKDIVVGVVAGMTLQTILEEAGFQEWLRTQLNGDRNTRHSNIRRR